MSGVGLGKLAIGVVSQESVSVNDAFISVTSDGVVDHTHSENGTASLNAESGCLVTVTISHPEYRPKTTVLRLSSNRQRQRIRLREIRERASDAQRRPADALEADDLPGEHQSEITEAQNRLESIDASEDEPESVYRSVLLAHQSLCTVLGSIDQAIAEKEIDETAASDCVAALSADITALESYADLLASNVDLLTTVCDASSNDGASENVLAENETSQLRDFVATFRDLPPVSETPGIDAESLAEFGTFVEDHLRTRQDAPASRAELLAEVERVANELERVPSHDDVRSLGEYSLDTYYDHFDSWAAVVEASDVDQRSRFARDVQSVAEQLDKEPTKAEYDVHGEYAADRVKSEFGSWRETLNHAKDADAHPDDDSWSSAPERDASDGGKDEQPETGRTGTATKQVNPSTEERRAEMLDAIRELYDELGRAPKSTHLPDTSSFTVHDFTEEFGSWYDAVETAGIDYREEVVEDVSGVAEKLGRPPTTGEMSEHGTYDSSDVYVHFDTWSEAKREAGVDDDAFETESTGSDPDADEMLSVVEDLYDELGRVPKASHLPSDAPFSRQEYVDRFGGWYEAIDAAELNFRGEVLEDIRDVASRIGHPPNTVEMTEHGRYDQSDAYHLFDTWEEAKEAAGVHDTDREETGEETTATGEDRGATGNRQLESDAERKLVSAVRDVARRVDDSPSLSDLSFYSDYDMNDVYRYFDSWNTVKELAGVSDEAAVRDLLDEPAAENGRDPSDDQRVPPSELAERYESFHRLRRAVDAVVEATDDASPDSLMVAWRDALEEFVEGGLDDWDQGYGPQQASRSTVKMREYREEYGDGDRVLDFQCIDTAPVDPVVESVLNRLDPDGDPGSLRLPVAPDSGDALPVFVESERELEAAGSLLAEFPPRPSADDWEWVSEDGARGSDASPDSAKREESEAGPDRDEPQESEAGPEHDERQDSETGEDSSAAAIESLCEVSGITERKAEVLYSNGYTSIEDLRAATVEELAETESISNQLALRIKVDVGE